MPKLIIILSIFGLILSSFGSITSLQVSFAQEDQSLKALESTAELKEFGRKFLEFFPKVFKAAWGEAVRIWKEVWGWVKNLWNNYIFPWLKSIWQKISDFFLTSIWEKLKELIK